MRPAPRRNLLKICENLRNLRTPSLYLPRLPPRQLPNLLPTVPDSSARETIRPSLPPVMPESTPALSGNRALRILFWIIASLMTAFVFGAFLLPGEVSVSRAVVIKAPPAAVFAQLESLRKWEAWGPWFQRDPFLEKEFSGPERGPGAMLVWRSKKEGQGKIKITSAVVPGTLRAAVDFGEGGDAEMAFDLRGTGDGATEVKWTLRADFGSNMARRYFGLLLPRMAGPDLEAGLASLQQLLEKPAAAP